MPTVHIPSQLRDLTSGVAQLEVDGVTVTEVISALEVQFPGIRARLATDGELAPSLQVAVDGTLSTRGVRAKLKPNSEVHFLPAFGGG